MEDQLFKWKEEVLCFVVHVAQALYNICYRELRRGTDQIPIFPPELFEFLLNARDDVD